MSIEPYSINGIYLDKRIAKTILGEINLNWEGYFTGVLIKNISNQKIRKIHGIARNIDDTLTLYAFELPIKKNRYITMHAFSRPYPPYHYQTFPLEGQYRGVTFQGLILTNVTNNGIIGPEEISLDTLPYIKFEFLKKGFHSSISIKKSYFQ